MTIPVYDFHIWQGNSGTVEDERGLVLLRLQDDGVTPVDMAGANVIYTQADGITKDSNSGDVMLDVTTGEIVIPFSVAETRAIVNNLKYELEVHNGPSQRTVLRGTIITHKGLNLD